MAKTISAGQYTVTFNDDATIGLTESDQGGTEHTCADYESALKQFAGEVIRLHTLIESREGYLAILLKSMRP